MKHTPGRRANELLQINRARIYAHSLCEQHLIADDPHDEAIQIERLRRMRILSPEYFRGQSLPPSKE